MTSKKKARRTRQVAMRYRERLARSRSEGIEKIAKGRLAREGYDVGMGLREGRRDDGLYMKQKRDVGRL